MKRALQLLLIVVALSALTFASDISLTGTGGTLSGSSAGLTLAGETLTVDGTIIGSLGSITLSTAKLLSGSLGDGGTFKSGGTFTITGNGTGGVFSGVIFAGVFDSLKWKHLTGNFYDLLGSFSGIFENGKKATGAFTLLTESTGSHEFNGSVKVASTDVSLQIASVPEPSTLVMLGTGLLGLAARYRLKMR